MGAAPRRLRLGEGVDQDESRGEAEGGEDEDEPMCVLDYRQDETPEVGERGGVEGDGDPDDPPDDHYEEVVFDIGYLGELQDDLLDPTIAACCAQLLNLERLRGLMAGSGVLGKC